MPPSRMLANNLTSPGTDRHTTSTTASQTTSPCTAAGDGVLFVFIGVDLIGKEDCCPFAGG
jgi:hypothetical protein